MYLSIYLSFFQTIHLSIYLSRLGHARLAHSLGEDHTQTVYNTKGTRAHTHGELIREWLWES